MGDELTMPSQERVWCDDRSDFAQRLPAKGLAFDSQTAPLVIVEPDALLTVRFLQNLVLGAQVVDDLLLLPIDPSGEDDEEKLPGLQDEVHAGSDAVSRNRKHRVPGSGRQPGRGVESVSSTKQGGCGSAEYFPLTGSVQHGGLTVTRGS